MESNYRNREFEQFVKENADQYRMFPSEKVWKGINSTLHTRRKWYGAGLALLLLMTGTAVTLVMVSYPVATNQKLANSPSKNSIASEKARTSSSPVIQKNVLPFNNSPEPPVSKEHTGIIAPLTGPTESGVIMENQATRLTIIPAEEQYAAITIGRAPVAVVSTKSSAINNSINELITIEPSEPSQNLLVQKIVEIPAIAQTTQVKTSALPAGLSLPLVEEAAALATNKPSGRKISWQVFLTPTISYRKLAENKSFDNIDGPAGIPAAPQLDVNNEVTHKPDMGFQLGVAARYKVTKSLRLRAGIQFNVNRYDIKAVAYNPELATIELNGTNGNGSTLAAWTPYRNNHKSNSFRSDWLKNFYFSVSAPFGAEMIILGKNKKTSLGVAGTVQPTYIINDRAYVISTNYKNYANIPSLTRHVNVNTGFETFVNFTNGRTQWQVGPQVRYQVLSSFNNKYAVKENLFDFGIKVGVTLNE